MDEPSEAEAREIAAYINRCTAELSRQAMKAGGWPNPLTLPDPRTQAERTALNLWVKELQGSTGAPVTINYKPLSSF